MKDWDQKFWNVFSQFGITIPFSATYFLKVGARVSLKVGNKGKKNLKFKLTGCFSKAKMEMEERD